MLEEFRRLGLLHTFVLPALLLFLIPTVSLFVFEAGKRRLDGLALKGIEDQIQTNPGLDAAGRREAEAFFREHPLSEMLESEDPEQRDFADRLGAAVKHHYVWFRWLTRLAWFCVVSGLGLIGFTAMTLPLSMRSQKWQYRSLLAGWHSIRVFLSLQVIAQGVLVVGLSFWITAILFRTYSIKLVGGAALLAGAGVLALLSGLFSRLPKGFAIEGEVLRPRDAPGLWEELKRVADRVGTATPDQMVVGIDDNFFVTENPMTVGEEEIEGKTLYASLSLLKAMSGPEAEAVLAHEFAHFSGEDTYYSRKIGPLLMRFNRFLHGLQENLVSMPVFYCALLMRTLYEVSLRKLSRDREFRADRVAASAVSPQALGDALVRIMAYAVYRRGVEHELFSSQLAHERVEIGQRLSAGFQRFASGFADAADLRYARPSHPFDSHPTLEHRLRAVGRAVDPEAIRLSLAVEPDGGWFAKIPGAEGREGALWARYEERFRKAHENSLAYRYLPSTPEEAAVVARSFPRRVLPARKNTSVTVDHDQIAYQSWPEPVRFDQISQLSVSKEWNHAILDILDWKARHFRLPLSLREPEQVQVIQLIQAYWSRFRTAAAFQEACGPKTSADPSPPEGAEASEPDESTRPDA